MPTRLFYIIYILFGLFFVFAIPPFQKPDEIVFFYKSVAVSRGNFTCQSNQLEPSHQLPKYLFDFPQIILTRDLVKHSTSPIPISQYKSLLFPQSFDNSLVADTSSCPLNPLLFTVPGLFMSLPVAFSLNPFLVFYVGRLSIFLFFLFITYLSLRLVPRKFLPVLYFVLLLPMTLNQVTAFGKDVWHLSFGFLAFSLYMRSLASKKPMSLKEFALFFISLSIAIITRWQYLPLVLLLLLIKVAGYNRRNRSSVLLLILIVLFGVVFSLLVAFKHLSGLTNYPYSLYVYPQEQLSYLIHNPGEIIHIFINSFAINNEYYLKSLFGILGWLDIPLSPFIYYGFATAFGIIVYKLSKIINIPRSTIVAFVLTITLIVLLDLFSFYIFFTPVGANSVTGIQGRYFLGLLPYVAIVAASLIKIFDHKKLLILLLICLSFSIATSVYHRYYDFSVNYVVATDQSTKFSAIVNKASLFPVNVDPSKKTVGFEVLFDRSSSHIVPHLVSLKSDNCQTTISQKVISANQINSLSSFTFVFDKFLSQQNAVCFEIAPLFAAPDNIYLHVTKISPIYRI